MKTIIIQNNGNYLYINKKGVLLHHGNQLAYIPNTHHTDLKETYENLQLLKDRITMSK